MKTFHLRINGKNYTVDVDLAASPIQVMVNGRPFRVEIMPEPPRPAAAPSPSAPPPPVHAAEPPPALLHVPEARPPQNPTEVAGAIRAPMPGKIVSVWVSVGDQVVRGQEVVVLEAMKMEQSLRSVGDGTVKAVYVQPGQSVTAGQVLLELE